MFGISRARKAPISDCGAFSDERPREGFASGAPGPSIEAPGPAPFFAALKALPLELKAPEGNSGPPPFFCRVADVVNGVV